MHPTLDTTELIHFSQTHPSCQSLRDQRSQGLSNAGLLIWVLILPGSSPKQSHRFMLSIHSYNMLKPVLFQASPWRAGELPPVCSDRPTWRQDGFAGSGRELGAADKGALGVGATVGEHAHGLAVSLVVHGHAVGKGGADAAVGVPVVPTHGLQRPAEGLEHTAAPAATAQPRHTKCWVISTPGKAKLMGTHC